MNKSLVAAFMLACLCAGLGACADVGAGVANGVNRVAVAASGQSAEARLHAAMAVLDRGDERRGRALLEAALRQEPGNATARRLLDEIDGDPARQLGPRMQTYTVRAGDTMTELAQRFAGDPLLFYALARFNHMAPNQLAADEVIQVPARLRVASVAPRGAAVAAPSVAPRATSASADAGAASRANQLRLQGLERLNAGDADGAVRLLQEGRTLDAGNTAIQGDLARALRIQASLSAH